MMRYIFALLFAAAALFTSACGDKSVTGPSSVKPVDATQPSSEVLKPQDDSIFWGT